MDTKCPKLISTESDYVPASIAPDILGYKDQSILIDDVNSLVFTPILKSKAFEPQQIFTVSMPCANENDHPSGTSATSPNNSHDALRLGLRQKA